MPVQLSAAPDPVPATPPGAPKRELDAPVMYWGDRLASEVRQAVERQCGKWGERRSRDSDHERDALMQTLALWTLEHRSKVEGLVRGERMALYRKVLREDLIRDSRAWQDSLEDRAVFRSRGRKAQERTLDLDSSAQAKRFREHERNQRPAPFTSPDVLIRRHRVTGDDHVDYLEVDRDRERERELGEQLPAVALVAGTETLARGMAAAILERLEDRPNPIQLTDRERESVEIALLVAESHNRRTPLHRDKEGKLTGGKRIGGIARVATATGMHKSRVMHLSADGQKLLAMLITPGELIRLRRHIARYLYRVSDPTPQSVQEVDRALGLDAMREAIDAAIVRGESTDEQPQPMRGSAREVLGYIARIERIMSTPATTYRTDGAETLPAPPTPPRQPIRDEWRDGDWKVPTLQDLSRWCPGVVAGVPLVKQD